MPLKIGSQSPDFNLQSNTGLNCRLSDFAGSYLVVYFYPKDNTPGCTLEAQEFSALHKEFEDMNCKIVGISADTIKSHCNFSDKYDLKIQLLSDEDSAAAKAFGVLKEKTMFLKKYLGIERSTFLINKEGMIIAIWPKVKANGHAFEVLERLKELG